MFLWLLGALTLGALLKSPTQTVTAIHNAYRGKVQMGQSKKVLQWAPLIKSSLEASGISESLRPVFFYWTLATIHHESGGNLKATSYKTRGTNNKGREFVLDANGNKIPLAKGLGQFIDAAWKSYGKGNPYNPSDMIPAMLRLFVALYKRGGGSLPKMAQAYYSGGMSDLGAKMALAKAKGDAKRVARLADIQRYIDKNMALYELYKTVPY